MQAIKKYFISREKKVAVTLGTLIPLLFLMFFSTEIPLLSLLDFGIPKHVFVLVFLFLLVLVIASLILFAKNWRKDGWVRTHEKLVLWLLPGACILLLCVSFARGAPVLFQLGLGLYVILVGLLLFEKYIHFGQFPPRRHSFRSWLREQGPLALFLVLLLTSVFFLSGLHRLTEFAAVDEPLWLEGRISKYWNNIADGDWDSTDVSDKPGITISLATGAGLLFKDAKDFDTLRYEPLAIGNHSGLERFYLAFRFPLLVIIALLLPFFYFFLERLVGKTAALTSYAFIATSPILVGMSKIINPDSLLWLFVPLSLLSYLVFLKNNRYRYLVVAGVFFGLALLTKYVANILLIFLFGLTFAEYLYHRRPSTESFAAFSKKALTDLFFYVFFALSVFYLLLPAVWVEPSELIESTILSQAFEKVAPLFLLILVLLFCDQYFNRARLSSRMMQTLDRAKVSLGRVVAGLFLLGLTITVVNVWSGMPLFHFMDLLESPKNILTRSDFLAGYLTNFYPLAFGIAPLLLLGLFLSPFFLFRKRFFEDESLRLSFYGTLFILLYYFGGTVNGVAAIVRYQIILFPLAAIIAGITLVQAVKWLETRWKRSLTWDMTLPLVVLISGVGILLTTPFPLSYASSLLPSRYYIDLKDMGPGSYEIAQSLNALPNAENIVIWTDKDGVCKFFVGECRRGFGRETLSAEDYDYIVVSSTRESRTAGMMANRPGEDDHYVPLHTYYRRDDPAFTVLVNGRPGHFVKAFRYVPGN